MCLIHIFYFMMHWSDTILAKKVIKDELRELIAMCIKKSFPKDDNEGYLSSLDQLKEDMYIDSIYIEIPNSGKYTKIDIIRLNKYFRRYAGTNLFCKDWDKNKNVLIIKNDYQIVD